MQSTAQAKADVVKRAVAAVIDGVLAGLVSLVPFVGAIAAAAYMLLRDGLDIDYMRQRSVGKTLMKLRPVTFDGQPMDINKSVQRNWMIALGYLGAVIAFIPILGWLAAPVIWLAAMVIGIVELVLVFTDSEGRRWGDKLAHTKVVEVAE